jgi:hypothetical protein
MTIRRFNAKGIQIFEAYVLQCRQRHKAGEPVEPVNQSLLNDPDCSTETDYELPGGPADFEDKLSIGEYFCRVIPDDRHAKARLDKELWTWLAAYFFDEITEGREKIKETRAYVASIGFQDFYRHLLLGPYFIYFNSRDNPNRVRVLLYNDPTTMNEVMVQFGSYQTLMQNKSLQSVVQRLFFDEEANKIKRGAGGKEAGTPRRLMDFFRQIELNYDLPSIGEDDVWKMLPKEFQKFKD